MQVVTRLREQDAETLERIAEANDRSVASELRRLIRQHLDANEEAAAVPGRDPSDGLVSTGG